MKTIQVSICSILFCLLIFSCSDALVGSGDIITETRTVNDFTKVEVEDAFDVRIIQGDEFLVEVHADDNLIDRISTEVTNGNLNVQYNGSVNVRNATTEIFIEMPTVERIELKDAVDAKVLNFTNLPELKVVVKDAADLLLSGDADLLNIDVSDASDVEAFSFIANTCNVQVEDASDLEIFCNTLLEGRVTDASTVRYRGYPDITATTSDASEIIDAN